MEEEREEVEPDPLISRYITGLYLQDPFYQVSRNCRRGGLFHLADIVSEDFETTEYYNTYFAHYVVTDEVQYNVPLDGERTLCLSLGSESRFGAEQIALFELLRPWVIALMKTHPLRGCGQEEAKPIAAAEVEVQPWRGLISPLTARESDVIRLMLDGYSNKEIADRLTLSIATIKVHRRHIYAKLNVKSHSEIFALLINPPAPRLADARQCAACGGTRAHKVMRNSYCPTLKSRRRIALMGEFHPGRFDHARCTSFLSFVDPVLCAVGLACALQGEVQAADGGPRDVATAPRVFDIAPGELAEVLLNIVRQGHVPIAFDQRLVAGLRGPDIRGRLSVEDALRRALAGSGLAYAQDESGAFVLRRGQAPVQETRGATVAPTLSTVVVTGTRKSDVKAQDSLSPIDVVSATQLRSSGAVDLRDALVKLLPSLTRQAQPFNASALTHTQSLRGLSPNHVLVLVNGKRRHETANLNISGGLEKGSTGVDLDTIPINAIEAGRGAARRRLGAVRFGRHRRGDQRHPQVRRQRRVGGR